MKTIEENSFSNEQILVVDDDTAILEAIQMSLELEGYRVLVAQNAKTALEAACNLKPKLVVLDVKIAGDDGRDIAKRLRRSPITADIPIIMMSAQPNIKESVLEAGANNFMPKPFNIEDLLAYAARYTKSTKQN
jgi:two-component system alkaline phosphatase synthesis response regulator PhoP